MVFNFSSQCCETLNTFFIWIPPSYMYLWLNSTSHMTLGDIMAYFCTLLADDG